MKNLNFFLEGVSVCFKKSNTRKILSFSFFLTLLLVVSQLSVNAQKTWTAASSGSWSVGANWSGGTAPISTDNVVLTPAAARTITVDGNFTINNLTVGNNTTLNFNAGAGLTVNGNFSQTGGIYNGGTSILNIKGTFSKTSGTFNEGTGTVSFTGTGTQTISTNDATRNFYNIIVNSTSGVSVIAPATNLTVTNNFALINGKFGIGSNTLTLNGTVSSMTAAKSLIGSTTSNLTIGGTGALGTLYFDNTTPGTTNLLNVLTLNRSTTGSFVLGNDVNVRTTLTLTNGIITTGSSKVILNSTGTLGRTNGYVNGNLQKNVATGATSRSFEIGDASNYTPVTLAFASVTTAGDLLVNTATPLSSQPNIGTLLLNASVAVNRYWNLTSVNTLVFTTYNGTFNFVAGDLIGSANTANLKAGVYNSSWAYPTMGTLNATNSTLNSVNVLGSVTLATCLSPTLYTVTGGGAYCSAGAGMAVGLSNSETGVNYQLQIGGVNTGSAVAGTGSAISFGNQTAAGTYTVIATRTATGCSVSMSGSVAVSINPLPSLSVTGTTTVCSGTTSISLNYSGPVNSPDQYSIVWGPAAIAAGFTNVGFTALSGGVINIPNIQSAAGTYPVDVLVMNSTTGCQGNLTSGIVCGMVAENATLSMSVPNGSSFTGVSFASYGTPTGTCGSFAVGSCHAANSVSIVQAAAVGQASFSIAATNAVFTDPCVGTVKSLYVQATYGFAITVSPPLTASISGATSICSGSSTTLTAPAATTYSWSTGATTQSITVSPASSTTYSVTISNAGCNSTGSQLITVNGLPSVTLSTNTPAVCSGINSTVLNYSSPVNSPDQYSIVWSAAGNAAGLSNVTNATLSGGTITLSGITNTAGTYPATITISNSVTGCSTSISSGTICNTVNESGTLSLTAPGGAKFSNVTFASYGTPNGTCGSFTIGACHATNSLSLVQAAAIGNTTFSIGANNGVFGDPCNGTFKRLYVEAVYSTFVLTVNAIPAAPTAGSNSPVCSGNTINLTASTVAGATYTWTGPLSYTSTSQNPSITSATVGMAGTYSVRSTVANCNSATTGNITVVVNAAPSATISYAGTPYCSSISTGQAVTLTGTTGGTFSAPAALNINSSTGAINPSLSTAGGPYTVTYSVAASGGCSAYSTTTTVTILAIPAVTTVSGAGTFCATRTITASGGTGGTIYFQGTTSGGTSTATASSSQAVTSSGTYYFRSRNVSGCWGTEGSVNVVIVPVPTCTGASAAAVCSGSTATVNLSGLVPGSVNTIYYSINGVAQTPVTNVTANGAGNASFNSVTLTTANNGQTLQVTGINNGTCSTASFAYNITLVVNTVNVWLGVNTNWLDAQNWCTSVPAGTANVTIPAGRAFYPVITAAVQTNNITIANGASVTLNGLFKVSGTISNSGILDATTGTLELNGTASAQTIAGSMFTSKTIKNLKISNSNGVSFSGTNDTLKISSLLSFGTSNAILTTNNNLTILSSATETASVGDMTNGGANSGNNITGNVTVERFIPNHPKAWEFLAVPTSGQTINAAWQEGNSPLGNTKQGYGAIITSNVAGAVSLGFDIYTSSIPSMKTYNPGTALWDGVTSPGLPIANKKGYMLFVRGDRSVTAYNQAATSTILRTTGKLFTIGPDAPPSTTVLAGKSESIGNPYASAIDFLLLTKTGSIDDKFYVWDPLLTNTANGYGGYQCLSATNSWKPVPGGTTNYDANTAYTTIQSGQAFFVYSSGSGGTVGFTESAKVNGSLAANRPGDLSGNRQFLRLNMYNANNILADGNIIAFDPEFSNEYDADDAIKLANTSENIGIKQSANTLSVEARKPVISADTVFYTFGNMKLQSYQLKFSPENMATGGLTAFLVDKFLNSNTPISLSDSTVINFTVTTTPASYAADRFYVVFRSSVVLPVTITNIDASYKQKDIEVNWKVENETSMQQYETEHSTDGRSFTKINTSLPVMNNGGSARYKYIHLTPVAADNFYRIKAISFSGQVQYSPIVKVSGKKLPGAINIYPNPVTGKKVQLQFVDQPEGDYIVSLIYSNGMRQPLSGLKVNGGQGTYSVLLPQVIAAGVYHLQITGPDNKVTIKTIQVLAD